MHYSFANCTLDTQLYVLQRAGTLHRLRPKVFQVLQYLLQHRERVIAKQELAEHLWPDQYICDAVVENTIMAVRRVVGDSGRAQYIIQTLPGHGYRFIATVAEPGATSPGGAAPSHTTSASVLSATAAAAPQPDLPSIVAPSTATLLQLPQWELLPAPVRASRRPITALCYDLVDAAALAKQFELDELHDVIHAYHTTCTEVMRRFEGIMVQHTGTGTVVYFGYPMAHEDDAARAVHTGLGLVAALDRLNTRLEHEHRVRLTLRLGIHTGLVVIEDNASVEQPMPIVFGETPTLAARIQALASPNTVVMSAATARLVQGMFVCHTMAVPPCQDMSVPGPLVQVSGTSAAQNRCAAARQPSLRPLVGRTEELRLLLHHWEQARNGRGQGVWLCGEGGIGKSRLVEALHEHSSPYVYTWKVLRCASYAQQSALYPVITYLQQRLGWRRDTPLTAKFATLEALLQGCDLPTEEAVPLFASLLGLPGAKHDTALPLSPEQHKHRLLAFLTRWLLQEAEQQPALIVWEDVHWADPSSLELLSLCTDQLPTVSALLLCTARLGCQPPWPVRSYLTQLTLGRLDACQVMQMVTNATAGKALPPEVLQEVITRSDGVPLFIEALLQMLLESGLLHADAERYMLSGDWSALAIPDTLHGLLLARLDGLGPAREVAQLGSALGRTFTYEMLRAIAPCDEPTLQQGLARLVDAELLYQRGLPPQAGYTFKHVLIQEAAYQSMLKRTRQHYHQQIAQVLETQCPETCDTQPELLAHHCTEAGLRVQAVTHWQAAGQRACRQSAYAEASSHFARGLEVLKAFPDTPERIRQAVGLHLDLGRALTINKGHAAPEVGAAYTQAWELVQQVGETAQYLPVLFGLLQFHVLRSDFQTVYALWEQLFTLAQRQQDTLLLVHAHRILGFMLLCCGEVPRAYQHIRQGMELYHPLSHRQHVLVSGQEPGLMCLTHAAQALWMLGYPTQAVQRSTEALALARELQRPYNLVCTLGWASWLHQHRREWWIVEEQAEAVVALATEHRFALWRATGMILQGWALAMKGQSAQGVAQIRQGLEALQDTGTTLMRPYFLALLAEAHGKTGQPETGRAVLAEAQAVAQRHGEQFYAVEMHRLEGELLLACSPKHTVEAEACFRRALECARSQHTKALELRAAICLSRLWQRQGRHTAASQLLAEIYAWFSEGFDTADLQEAGMLLQAVA